MFYSEALNSKLTKQQSEEREKGKRKNDDDII